MAEGQSRSKTFIVEHLDPELGSWSALEYQTIAKESTESATKFCLSSVPKTLELSPELRAANSVIIEHRSVDEIFIDCRDSVCLLDPAASQDLHPDDGILFNVFLFGGILGMGIHLTSKMSVDTS